MKLYLCYSGSVLWYVTGAHRPNDFSLLVAYSRAEFEQAIGENRSLVISADPKMFDVAGLSGRIVWFPEGDSTITEARAHAEAGGRESSCVVVLSHDVLARIRDGLVWVFDHRTPDGERRRCSVGRLAFCVANDFPACERACVGAGLGSIVQSHAGNPYRLAPENGETISGG